MPLSRGISAITRRSVCSCMFPRAWRKFAGSASSLSSTPRSTGPKRRRACGKQPPRQAFPRLPTLPPLPAIVQAARWLWRSHHRVCARLIGSDGCVTVHHETSSISTHMAGRKGALVVDAPTAAFEVLDGGQMLKRLSSKQVVRGQMPLSALHCTDARAGTLRRAPAARLESALATRRVGPHPLSRDRKGLIGKTLLLLSKGCLGLRGAYALGDPANPLPSPFSRHSSAGVPSLLLFWSCGCACFLSVLFQPLPF
jgi:hypothetical protein